MAFQSLRLAILSVLIAASTAMAQLPTARLLTISPAGGQIGMSFEVVVSGADLDDASELRFSDTNITAQPKISSETALNEPNRFVVMVSSNALPGICEARVAGRFGLSNSRRFAIGGWLEVAEKAGNHFPGEAMDATIGSTVNGQADANAVDHFRFLAKKGERVLIQCRAREIDSRMSPTMLLYDDTGRELQHARNEELLDFTASEDGTNMLRVSDSLYRGGSEFFYRLTIHTGPHLDFMMPHCAIPGTTSRHVLCGRNLPGGIPAADFRINGRPLDQLAVEIVAPSVASAQSLYEPAALPLEGFEYRLRSPAGVSEPVFIGFAAAPVVMEQEGSETPQKVEVPCEYVGQFYPAGDRDAIQFDAKKGEVFWVEVVSDRMGARTDPFILVQRITKNDKGEVGASDLHEGYDLDANIGGREFKTSSFDAAWRLDIKEDGAYRVQVRDLFGRLSSDLRRLYRLAVRRETPDFQLVVLPQLPATKKEREVMPWSNVLRRGETIPIRVLALHRDGFDGEIRLSIEDPPQGISFSPAKIESGKSSALLFLTASEDATNENRTIKVLGQGRRGETEVLRAAVGGTVLWTVEDFNTEAVQSRMTQVTIGVVPEPAPITIAAVPTNTFEAPAGSKLAIPLSVARRGDFNEKLKLKIAGASGLESLKEIEVDSKATNATFEIDLAAAKLSAGTYNVHFQTQTKGKYAINSEGAKLADAAAKDAEKLAADAAAESKKAAEALAEAEKTGGEAEARAKSDAENLVAETAAKSKRAEARKTALTARAKQLAERAKAKELTISVYSQPFEIKVKATPATTAKK